MSRAWLALFFAFSVPALADQVILKDGKILEGRVMGEGTQSILLSQPGQPPKFIPLNDVMTIVREKNPEVPNPDRDRFIVVESMLGSHIFQSDEIDLTAAPGLNFTGGFRLHPLFQIEGGLEWTPVLTGEMAVTDGTTARRYERFYAWGGGFGAKIFPLAKRSRSVWEPSILGGWRWQRLVPKGSGDALKGTSWNVGLGLAKSLSKRLSWENRVMYQHTTFKKINYLQREGTLRPSIDIDTWTLQTGLSFKF